LAHLVDADAADWVAQLPDLHFFNFGGGMPTDADAIDFVFDYVKAFYKGVTRRHGNTHVRVLVWQCRIWSVNLGVIRSHHIVSIRMEVGAVKAWPWWRTRSVFAQRQFDGVAPPIR
jgi:hypothetical protein